MVEKYEVGWGGEVIRITSGINDENVSLWSWENYGHKEDEYKLQSKT